jgi:hypothetical protein
VISKRALASSIDRAHEHVEFVWNTLFPRDRSRSNDFGQQLINCQNKLIEALWILDREYQAISKEKKRLIKNKAGYVPAWFARRMAQLDG